jgi:hypothetical protein
VGKTMKKDVDRIKLIFFILLIIVGINILPSTIGNVNIESIDYFTISNDTENLGLLSYWSFDEGNGNIAHDSSGHGFDGTIIESVWVTGHSGFALDFNGKSSHVNLDLYSKDLGFNKTDDYKISTWIKSESGESGVIYMMTYSSYIPIFYIKINPDGTLQMNVESTDICGLIINSTNSYNDGLWHYIEGIYYGSEVNPLMELYVDGELVGSDIDWLCPMISIQFKLAKIGMSTNGSEFFDGIIDEFKVYKIPGGNKPPAIPNCIYDKKNDELMVNSTDTNGDKIRYGVSWNNDQNVNNWTEFYDSGVLVTVDCEGNNGPIGVIAEDVNGAQSGWVSVTSNVISTKIPLILERFFQHFPFMIRILNQIIL